ncbi:MAG: superinfection immunity protein [Verrucomicrobia bacterium]|nr:superinfection immunity protein [Verrucomicrobiota bacterium]
MTRHFSESVEVGDGKWISGFFTAAFGFLFFSWPAMIWDNGFVAFLALLGIIYLFFAPIFQCDANIAEHAEIKSKSSESYDSLVRKYGIKHPNKNAVIWINWLLGATVIGWFIALYLAHSKKTLDLPAGFVRELNQLYDKTFPTNLSANNITDDLRNVPQAYAKDETASLDKKKTLGELSTPPIIEKVNTICKTCGANNTVTSGRSPHHTCEFCGGTLGVQVS